MTYSLNDDELYAILEDILVSRTEGGVEGIEDMPAWDRNFLMSALWYDMNMPGEQGVMDRYVGLYNDSPGSQSTLGKFLSGAEASFDGENPYGIRVDYNPIGSPHSGGMSGQTMINRDISQRIDEMYNRMIAPNFPVEDYGRNIIETTFGHEMGGHGLMEILRMKGLLAESPGGVNLSDRDHPYQYRRDAEHSSEVGMEERAQQQYNRAQNFETRLTRSGVGYPTEPEVEPAAQEFMRRMAEHYRMFGPGGTGPQMDPSGGSK